MKNKVIAITGGNRLIGKELVGFLKEKGALVVNGDLEMRTSDPNFILLDITREESVQEFIHKVIALHGRIDGWVNNAYPRTDDWSNRLDDIKIDSWRKNIDMHLNGYFICCKLVIKQMEKQQKGSVVNMASIYGMVGPDFNVYEGTHMTMPAAYSAIKGGIVNMTRYLASYAGAFNVRVNCVSPGGIRDQQPHAFIEKYEKKVPLKRLGKPSDIAPGVAFLLSDESSYITGHNLVIDGGWTAI